MKLLEKEDRLTATPVRVAYPQPGAEWERQRLAELALRAGTRTLEIDFSDVAYVTAEDLGNLLLLRKKVVEQGGRLVLSCMSEQIREIFCVTNLDQVFLLLPEGEPDADPFTFG